MRFVSSLARWIPILVCFAAHAWKPCPESLLEEELTEAWTAPVLAETRHTVAQQSGQAMVQSTAAADTRPQSLSNLAAPQEEGATAESQDGNTSLTDDGASHRAALRAV